MDISPSHFETRRTMHHHHSEGGAPKEVRKKRVLESGANQVVAFLEFEQCASVRSVRQIATEMNWASRGPTGHNEGRAIAIGYPYQYTTKIDFDDRPFRQSAWLVLFTLELSNPKRSFHFEVRSDSRLPFGINDRLRWDDWYKAF